MLNLQSMPVHFPSLHEHSRLFGDTLSHCFYGRKARRGDPTPPLELFHDLITSSSKKQKPGKLPYFIWNCFYVNHVIEFSPVQFNRQKIKHINYLHYPHQLGASLFLQPTPTCLGKKSYVVVMIQMVERLVAIFYSHLFDLQYDIVNLMIYLVCKLSFFCELQPINYFSTTLRRGCFIHIIRLLDVTM